MTDARSGIESGPAVGATFAPIAAVRWSELFPWLLLVRALRVSLMARVIMLAVAGVFLTQSGWTLIESVFWRHAETPGLTRITERPPPSLVSTFHSPLDGAPVDFRSLQASAPLKPDGSLNWNAMSAAMSRPDVFEAVDQRPFSGPLARGWAWMVQPVTRLYGARGLTQWVGLILAGLWLTAVWALFGGAIARISAIYLTRGEAIGPWAALRSAAVKWPSTAGSSVCTFLAIVLIAVPLIVVGLALRLDALAFLAALLWIAVIGIGVAAAIVALGLLFGWPLMWSTIAVEQTDAFDAISRGFAYIYQRPLHTVFFIIVSTALGLLGQTVLSTFVDVSLASTRWLTGVGAGRVHSAAIFDQVEPTPAPVKENATPAVVPAADAADGEAAKEGSGSNDTSAAEPVAPESPVGMLGRAASSVIAFWSGLFAWISAAFPVAYIWPTSVAMYLLLRRLIDATELGDSSFDPLPPERGLPTLAGDSSNGVPQVVADAPAAV